MKLLPVGQSARITVEGVEGAAPLDGLVQASAHDEVLFSLPGVDARLPYLQVGTAVSLRFTNPMGVHGVRATVVGVAASGTLEITLGEFRDEQTFQRRSYFRLGVSLPVTVTVLAAKKADVGRVDKRAVTSDISGGGLRLDTFLNLEVEDRIAVALAVPQKLHRSLAPTLEARATVVRVEPVVRGGFDLCRAGVEFVFRRDIERDPWVRLALDLQRGADK